MSSYNRIILVILLLPGYLLSHAQTQIQAPIVSDSFDDNRYNWWVGETGGGSAKIEDGKMKVSFPEKGWVLSINPFLEYEKDFKAEVAIRQLDGENNKGVGIAWGYSKKKSDYNYFIVSGNGFFYVACTGLDSKAEGVGTWIKTDFAKPLNEVNVLRVEQIARTLTFYVNDQKVFSTPAFKWQGAGIGVYTYTKMKVEVEDFKFIQDQKITLPANLKKGLIKENLGPGVNTMAADLVPIITADGKQLYFGRENYEGNVGGKEDGEDFYVSEFDGNKWGVAKNMGSPINTTAVNNIISVSSDNNKIIFVDSKDFFSRSRTADGSWGPPVWLGLSYVNEATHFEGSLSADGKSILFAAMNSNNLFYEKDADERDIYVSTQDQNGKWSSPINLGATINTRASEFSPFLAADNRTLYFSTPGKPGFGDADIFMSKRVGNGWTNWTEPVNLGPEINSSHFDAYYTLPASGDYAYMVENDGVHGADIIRIKLQKELKPDPVVLVKGKTLDAKTQKPIATDIIVENLSTGKEVGEAISDPQTGDYRIVLPFGVNYGFHGAAKGYLSVNENLELITISKYTEISKDLYLLPIVEGQKLQLNNVFFEQAKAILKPESYPELDRLIQIMKDNATMEIELGGYTDNIGSPTSLIVLSMDRAGMVKKYMVDKGIAARRITGKGYGSANPIVKNDTEEHRRMNRRVEFKITKK